MFSDTVVPSSATPLTRESWDSLSGSSVARFHNMDLNDLHPADDYSNRFFIWHEWIQANGPLTAENVFDYFATSMFYDKQSNNQVLRMQTMHTGMPIANEAEELKRFTGVEFAVVHAEPPSLFVIHKRERFSPEETRPMAAYFIMNNRIYQSPDVYHVLSNRLLTSLYSLQSSMDILRKYRPDYTPRSGWAWPIAETAAEDLSKKARAGSVTPAESQDIPETLAKAKTSASMKHQNTALLLNAMRTTAVHSKKPLNVDVQQAAGPDSAATETPAGTVPRSSATPGPVSTPQPSVSGSQESIGKAAPGAAKKKRKRASIVAPPPTS